MQTSFVGLSKSTNADGRILGKAVDDFVIDGDRLRILKVLNHLKFSFEDALTYVNDIQKARPH